MTTTIKLTPEARARRLANGKITAPPAPPVSAAPKPTKPRTPEQAARHRLTQLIGAELPCFRKVMALAVNIDREIVARFPGVDPLALHRAIRSLVRTRAYQRALARPDAMRHDIDAAPVAPVIEHHQRFAQVKLG